MPRIGRVFGGAVGVASRLFGSAQALVWRKPAGCLKVLYRLWPEPELHYRDWDDADALYCRDPRGLAVVPDTE